MKNVLSGGRHAGYDKNGKQEVQEVGSGGAERVILETHKGPGRVPWGPGGLWGLPGGRAVAPGGP